MGASLVVACRHWLNLQGLALADGLSPFKAAQLHSTQLLGPLRVDGLVCKLADEPECLQVPVDSEISGYRMRMHLITHGNRGCTAGEC